MTKLVEVKCCNCGKDMTITKSTYNRHIKKYGHDIDHYCKECSHIGNSKRAKKQWDDMSDEKKSKKLQELKTAVGTRWANMNDDERRDLSERARNQWFSYSEEEQKRRLILLNNGTQKYFKEQPRVKKLKPLPKILTEEEKRQRSARRSVIMKSIWNNLSDEDRRRRIDLMHKGFKKYRETMSDDERQRIDKMNTTKLENYWASLSEEELIKKRNEISSKTREWYNNLSDEDKEKIAIRNGINSKLWWQSLSKEDIEQIAEVSRERWNSLSEEEKQESLSRMRKGRAEWWESLSEEEQKEYYKQNANVLKEFWESASKDIKSDIHRRRLLNATAKDNQFNARFESAFNECLIDYFYYVPEYPTMNNNVTHCWDYAIFDQNGELECLVDLDGAYYHADNCDYNGLTAREEYDESRAISIPIGIKTIIVYESEFDKSFKYLLNILSLSYDEFVDKRFKEYRIMPFPYPYYTNKELHRSYDKLCRIDPNDKYHQDISVNTRNGDRLVMQFHNSIFHARIDTYASPHDIWKNDEQLRGMIYNHELLHTYINKNKIVQGFNLKYRVPFMSAGQAKSIINKYLSDYDEIFDPFSEFSGRMLGTISLGKRYIGQDASEIHVQESQNVIEWLYENMYEFDVHISCADSYKTKGTYQCLFTSLPRRGESYDDVPETRLTCDEWIDVCLKNYQCSKYVFVVDNTEKYIDNIDIDLNNEGKILIF